MLIGFLYTLFVLLCFFLIFVVLLQRSKGSLGIIGSVGSNAQLLFGGGGGQDFLKKLTWWCVAFFMGGSLGLALLQNWAHYRSSRYLAQLEATPIVPVSTVKPSLPEPDTQSGSEATTAGSPAVPQSTP